ncbi:L,D-transpeptidase family protein [Novosphingobium sp. Gsoil 351]|uniref:L,D-transpeptidase family protein n=1 Tax=Novosphingobium sp. Gsoil 351 TaxID=2675225 RepID=UPI0012B4AE72|nr:L,D-transpeptidase family protein [Novosphingobium sp. Gsoil 351]QGN53864.1 L,D-transpeptidase family protein [Novosphingobium sp. Gsoil 351]
MTRFAPPPSRSTLWTGTGISLAAAAFVSTLVLLEGLPSRGDAAAPAVARTALALKPAPTPVAQFTVKRILPIQGAIKYGEWHWDERGAPAAGTTIVTVDLKANVLSVFRDGYEIGATAILTGYGDKPTPLGVFPITEKDRTHVSTLYDAPMPYMLRLTNDGVSIHATKVENGYVTHGCVGVPEGFAAKLFAAARLGDRVIVTDGATMGLGDAII